MILLRGLRVLGHHGASPGEQDQPQPFEIDLDVEADTSVASRSDGLADTVDYGALVVAAARVVEQERWHLLERLARRVADEVLATDQRVDEVTVTVRKLRPPVPHDLASAGVRLRRGRRAFLGLGTNLGDRTAHLRAAVTGLTAAPGVSVTAVSPVYETEPVGGPEAQPPYLNLVVEIEASVSPRALLAIAQRLEAAAGRDRSKEERFGARPLDIDLLWIEGVTVDEPHLVVPHPRMHERRFVLAPLADLAPEVFPEHTGKGNVRRVGRL
ncbi:MAG: 2-amino-4-hydroxy-6-hydroxymethyldihydropteridine diphosphokinase [Acidimicrobiales bacterium]